MKGQIEAFLDHLASERKFSENTVAAYRNDLYQLLDFSKEKNVSRWEDVDRQLILTYLLDLKERGYALTTVARKTASAKSLFKFLVNSNTISNVPTENLGSPRVKKSSPQPLTPEEIKELLKQPDKYTTPEAQRDKAMMELLYASGMQVRELMSLNIHDVHFHDGSVSFMIKGARHRNGTIPCAAVPALTRYVDEARPRLAHQKDESALFLNRLGERLTRQGLWQIIKAYAKEARLDNQVTLRALRHSFAAHSGSKS